MLPNAKPQGCRHLILTGKENISAIQRRVLIPHLHNPEPKVLKGFADSLDLRAGKRARGRDIPTRNS